MTWSYTQDPSSSDKDAVRFELQDVDQSAPLMQDEEIAHVYKQETQLAASTPAGGTLQGWLSAAAHCCEALAVRFSMQADTVVGSLKVDYTKQAAGFTLRAKELRARAQGMHAPYAGGMSKSEKDSIAQDSDRVQPVFARDAFRNPWTGPGTGYGPDPLTQAGEIGGNQ